MDKPMTTTKFLKVTLERSGGNLNAAMEYLGSHPSGLAFSAKRVLERGVKGFQRRNGVSPTSFSMNGAFVEMSA